MSGHATSALLLNDASLLKECEVDTYRASGPGGQKRNKTDSAVRIRHLPTGIAAISHEDRSQQVNRRRALRRLRLAIALEIRTLVDLPSYAPSEVLNSYVTSNRSLRIGTRNPDYPVVVSEVMDVFDACGWRVGDAATALGLSTARLSQFVHSDPPVLRKVNHQRKAEKLGPLQ